jgi:hypothetical protein
MGSSSTALLLFSLFLCLVISRASDETTIHKGIVFPIFSPCFHSEFCVRENPVWLPRKSCLMDFLMVCDPTNESCLPTGHSIKRMALVCTLFSWSPNGLLRFGCSS